VAPQCSARSRSKPGPWCPVAVLLLGVTLVFGGCASTPGDPLEPVNRKVHAFNESFDRRVARPVAEAYDNVTPRPVNRSVTNFFNNLDDVTVFVNSGLQLKGGDMAATGYRLMINTTAGIFGLFDVAAATGQRKRNEDFGQTLGYWGVPAGPYLVIPFLGPSNFRDAPSLYVDVRTNPSYHLDEIQRHSYFLVALYAVDTRASLLGASDLFDTAATDSYSFMRDAWSRRRANQVHDGDPPDSAIPGYEDDDFDPFDDEGDEDLFD